MVTFAAVPELELQQISESPGETEADLRGAGWGASGVSLASEKGVQNMTHEI